MTYQHEEQEAIPKPELVTRLQAIFDGKDDKFKLKSTNPATGSAQVAAGLIPQLNGRELKFNDPVLERAVINSENIKTGDESWDDFSLRKIWASGSVLIDGQKVELEPPFNVYTVVRNAWDIGGSGDTATGDRSFFRYIINDNGQVTTEGSRYGSGHWSNATTPEEAAVEIIAKFEPTEAAAPQ